MIPSLGLINLQEWIRVTFYLLDYLFIIKGYITQEQPEGRDAQGKASGKSAELPCPL